MTNNGSNLSSLLGALHARAAATDDTVSKRRVWGVPLGAWVPYFMAMNARGRTHLPSEDLGVPLRLRRSKDGTVKLKDDGTPSFVVAKSIRGEVAVMQANFIASLAAEVKDVQASSEEAYTDQVFYAQAAADGILGNEKHDLGEAIKTYLDSQPKPEPERELIAA